MKYEERVCRTLQRYLLVVHSNMVIIRGNNIIMIATLLLHNMLHNYHVLLNLSVFQLSPIITLLSLLNHQ